MNPTDHIVDPARIESTSFEIIDAEVGPHPYDDLQWPVVRRIIHTTADFDFASATYFSDDAVDRGIAALRGGAPILCDTNMVLAGVSKPRLKTFGCDIACLVADRDVAEEARREGVTRSIVATRKGARAGCGIYLIGNAPTALFELLRLVREEGIEPALVVGAPVGFVGAKESKEALVASGLPCIVTRGRKGGSAIAATILNALMILATEEGS